MSAVAARIEPFNDRKGGSKIERGIENGAGTTALTSPGERSTEEIR